MKSIDVKSEVCGSNWQRFFRGLVYVGGVCYITFIIIYNIAIEHNFWNILWLIPLYIFGNYIPEKYPVKWKHYFMKVDKAIHHILNGICPPYWFL